MSKQTDVPSSGYYVEVDVTGDLFELRRELNQRGIHLVVLELDGPAGGNPLVRLRASGWKALAAWLDENEYDANPIVNARNPNWIRRADGGD